MTETETASRSNVDGKLLESVIQDEDYFAVNPDAKKTGLSAISHWREVGWREGGLPNSLLLTQEWDGFRHRAENSINAWDHDHGSVDFIQVPLHKKHGLLNICSRYLAESLEEPNPLLVLMYTEQMCLAFDPDFYGEDNQLSHLHPGLRLRHYLQFGWKSGRRPAENYDADMIEDVLRNRGLAVGIRDAGPSYVNYETSGNELTHDRKRKSAERILELTNQIFRSASELRFSEGELSLFKKYFDAKAFAELTGLPDDLEFYEILNLYLNGGWRSMPDTGRGFDADFYIKRYTEVDGADISPLEHFICYGRAQLRQPQSWTKQVAKTYQPLVSIIVPNFNHEKFLERRLASIEEQTYRNFEVILLDDNSSDQSRGILTEWAEREHSFPVRIQFNETNSGNVFSQWERGMALAEGELIWICESDDSCDENFLETLVPHFSDSSINMALGCIEFIGRDDEHIEGMSGFRNFSEPDIWEAPIKRTAAEWFAGAWGVNNIVANVGGSLFRSRSLPSHVFQTAKSYKIAGDWYLYTHLVASGRMIFDPKAKAYFRQHGGNTSASNFNRLYYYQELARIRTHVRSLWPAGDDVDSRFMRNVQAQWLHYNMDGFLEEKVDLFSQAPTRDAKHIVIAYLGPRVGGGEIIATHLANALAELSTEKQPIFVSLFAHVVHDPSSIIQHAISDRVSVYSVETALEYSSPVSFLKAISADIINSHMCLNDEYFLRNTDEKIDIPYTVTLHGSHQGASGEPLEDDFLMSLLLGVDLWLYTAPQNLKILRGIPLHDRAIRHISNAMPEDDSPAEVSRDSLGISEKAFVFTLVARGIERKGWRASIEALLKILQQRPYLDIHLLLVGDGPRVDSLRAEHKDHRKIHFLGYQTAINGLYRLSDCALLPTRFEGESYPLCLIQALMEGIPAIAGDVGYIRDMMTIDSGEVAGILLDPIRETDKFVHTLAVAMEVMLDPNVHKDSQDIALSAGGRFGMDTLAREYLNLFSQAISLKIEKTS